MNIGTPKASLMNVFNFLGIISSYDQLKAAIIASLDCKSIPIKHSQVQLDQDSDKLSDLSDSSQTYTDNDYIPDPVCSLMDGYIFITYLELYTQHTDLDKSNTLFQLGVSGIISGNLFTGIICGKMKHAKCIFRRKYMNGYYVSVIQLVNIVDTAILHFDNLPNEISVKIFYQNFPTCSLQKKTNNIVTLDFAGQTQLSVDSIAITLHCHPKFASKLYIEIPISISVAVGIFITQSINYGITEMSMLPDRMTHEEISQIIFVLGFLGIRIS